MAFGRSRGVVCLFLAIALSNNGTFAWRRHDPKNHVLPVRPKASRILTESTDSNPSLTEDGSLIYRYYEEAFVLDLYGLEETLSAPDVQLLGETTTAYLNTRLDPPLVGVSVSITRVLDQNIKVQNSISVLSLNLRILGQAVSTNAQEIASLSFENLVLDIFTKNPSGFKRSLKKASNAFDRLLAPRVSLSEPVVAASDSGDDDKSLLVVILASVGAAVLTAIVLGICLWYQKRSNVSVDSSKMEKGDNVNDELGIASTWSSSDESSEAAQEQVPLPVIHTPPKLRSFPTQERRNLSPCIEEGTAIDDGEDESSEISSHEGIYSLKNWTYSSVRGSL